MRAIPPYSLWLGNCRDARDPQLLRDSGIAAVVDLADIEPIAILPRDLIYCRFPISDGGDNARWLLRFAIQTVAQLLHANIVTLVACSAGMSRSPCIAAAALSLVTKQPPNQTLIQCIGTAAADVSPLLWHDVCAALVDE